MNENWMIFLAGLILGALACGFVTYKVEEDRILVMESEQQKALIEAQQKVITKQQEGQTINQKVSKEYEDKIAALNARLASGKLQTNPKHRMPSVSQSAARTDDTCRIKLESLQEWVNDQVKAFNK